MCRSRGAPRRVATIVSSGDVRRHLAPTGCNSVSKRAPAELLSPATIAPLHTGLSGCQRAHPCYVRARESVNDPRPRDPFSSRERIAREVGARHQLYDPTLARRAPSTIDASLAQVTLGTTRHWRTTDVPKPQSAPAITRSGPTTRM